MDNFMDKLAQKWNASELIKANSAAEAMELKRLQEQVAEYETILQEMRKLNLKNSELTDQSRELVNSGIDNIKELLQENEGKQKTIYIEEKLSEIEEQLQQIQVNLAKTEEENKQSDDIMNKIEDFVHKENVKVYRNVQAVVVDNLKAQTEELQMENGKITSNINGIKPFLIVTLILLIGNVGIGLIQLLAIFGIF